MSERDLILQVELAELALNAARERVGKARKALTDAESNLIDCNISLERLREQLRQYQATAPECNLDASPINGSDL